MTARLFFHRIVHGNFCVCLLSDEQIERLWGGHAAEPGTAVSGALTVIPSAALGADGCQQPAPKIRFRHEAVTPFSGRIYMAKNILHNGMITSGHRMMPIIINSAPQPYAALGGTSG